MNKKLFLVLAIFLLFATIPFMVSYLAVPKGYHFNGFLINPIDGHSYLAKMQEGRNGEWLFKLPYSSKPGEGVFLFTYYILLGHIAGILSLPNIFVFHIARIINDTFLFYIVLRLCKEYFNPEEMFYVVGLLIFGSGLGWALLPFGYTASDFKIPEVYPFLSSLTNPHFPLAIGLMLLIFILFQHNFRYKITILGFISIVLTVIQPFCMIIVLGIIGLHTIIEWRAITIRKIGSLISLILPAAIFGVYLFSITNNNAAIQNWNLQNRTPSPPILDLLIALSPMILFTMPGIYFILKARDKRYYFPVIWVLLALLMSYIPINLQRRLLIGLFIPVCIMGIYGLKILFKNCGRYLNVMRKVVFVTSIPSTFILIIMSSYLAILHNPNLVMEKRLWQSLQWVDHNVPSKSLILTTPEIGLYIPAYSNNRVIYGHPFETINAELNKTNVSAFFSTMDQVEQLKFVETESVDYILVNSDSVHDYQISPLINSTQVYDENDVKIYLVKK